MTHPRLYSFLINDYSTSPDEFEPTNDPGIHYMLAHDGDTVLGLFITHWIISPLTWEVHHAILPEHFKRTDELGRAFEEWLWVNTPAQVAVGFTPSFNRAALKYAKRHGMQASGVIPFSYPKFGKLWDILIFNKARPLCYNK